MRKEYDKKLVEVHLMMTRNVKKPLRSLDGNEYSGCDEQRALSGGHRSAYH